MDRDAGNYIPDTELRIICLMSDNQPPFTYATRLDRWQDEAAEYAIGYLNCRALMHHWCRNRDDGEHSHKQGWFLKEFKEVRLARL